MNQKQNKFITATLRLTVWYLGILMGISLIFSVMLYHASYNEINQGLRRQAGRLRTIDPAFIGSFSPADLYDAEIQESQTHLRNNLLLYNLIILVVGGAASYWFARRTLRPIEQAVEAQSRFTADASHELRTPLTAMRSEIEVALRGGELSSAEARELLSSNLEEIAKLEALSSSLLQLARYDEGRSGIELAECELPALAKDVVEKLSKVAATRRITIELKSPKSLKFQADAASVRELLSILLDNAVKYSNESSAVRLELAKKAHHAVVTVTDEGVGIKASQLPHLFERFYRADASRAKTQVNGYGLGLAIAKGIVDAHSGTIEVTSTPGKGSSFTVKLPLSHHDELPA